MDQDENLYVSHDPRTSQFDFDLYPGDLLGTPSPHVSSASTIQSSRTCQPPPPCPGSQGSSSNDSGIKDASPLIDQISQLLHQRLGPLEHKIDTLNETVTKLRADVYRLENAPVLCSRCRIFETKTADSFENIGIVKADSFENDGDDNSIWYNNSDSKTTEENAQGVKSLEPSHKIGHDRDKDRPTNIYENFDTTIKSQPITPCRTKESAYLKMTGVSMSFDNIGYGELSGSENETANKTCHKTPDRSPKHDSRNNNQQFRGTDTIKPSETRDNTDDKGNKVGANESTSSVYLKSGHIRHETRKLNNQNSIELQNKLYTNNVQCKESQVTASSNKTPSKIEQGSLQSLHEDTKYETNHHQTSDINDKGNVNEKRGDVPSECHNASRNAVKRSIENDNQEAYINRRMSFPTYCGRVTRQQPITEADQRADSHSDKSKFSRHTTHTNRKAYSLPRHTLFFDPSEYCKLRLESESHENKANEIKEEYKLEKEAKENFSNDMDRQNAPDHGTVKEESKPIQSKPSAKTDFIYSEVTTMREKVKPTNLELSLSNNDDEQSTITVGGSLKRKSNGSNRSPLKCALCNMMLGVDIKPVTDLLWSEGLVSDSVYNQVTFSGQKIGEVDELWDRLIDELNHLEETRSDAAFSIVDRYLSDKHPSIAPEMKRLYTLHDHRFKCRCKPRTYTV